MALKLRKRVLGTSTYAVGAAELNEGDFVKLSSSLLVVCTAASDKCIGVMDEAAAANATNARVVDTPGSIVFVNAHDASITEGEYLVPAAAGRADGAAAFATAEQTVVAQSLMASSAQDQKIAARLVLAPAPKAAS